jgi:predicted Zn-dependent protease with MMP-like domain
MLPRNEFEQLVAQALDNLPPQFHQAIDNVEVLIEAWPSPQDLRTAGLSNDQLLLGLYHGIPLTDRTHGYALVAPDTITIYQGPIEQVYRTPQAIRDGVRHTVIHELAHHFGIDDDRLRELGAY